MVNVRFDPKQPPKVEDVHAVLAGLFRQNGCVTCGLTGIDLRLQLSDPAERLEKMDNVHVPVEVTVQKSSRVTMTCPDSNKNPEILLFSKGLGLSLSANRLTRGFCWDYLFVDQFSKKGVFRRWTELVRISKGRQGRFR
jgi:hypothetical protein